MLTRKELKKRRKLEMSQERERHSLTKAPEATLTPNNSSFDLDGAKLLSIGKTPGMAHLTKGKKSGNVTAMMR